jgi:molecular chaperone DnaK
MYSTATDGQTSVEIHALQGERALVKDNKSLGKFLLKGIPPAPRSVPQIEVTFEIDANGILKVSAQDKGTSKEQSIQISNTGGLSETEVERMRQEAELYADEDLDRAQLVELKNQADSLVYNCDVTLKTNAQLLGDDLKVEAQTASVALRAAIASPDITCEELAAQIESFKQLLYSLGTAVYDQARNGEATTTSSTAVESEIVPELDEFEGFEADDESILPTEELVMTAEPTLEIPLEIPPELTLEIPLEIPPEPKPKPKPEPKPEPKLEPKLEPKRDKQQNLQTKQKPKVPEPEVDEMNPFL